MHIRKTIAGSVVLGLLLAACATAFAARPDIPATQQQWRLVRGAGSGYALTLADAPVRQPGAHEVLVRVRAVSLNRRDVFVRRGQYNVTAGESFVPLSDGAGEILAVGPGVRRFRVGDRVVATFFQSWLSGPMTRAAFASALGGGTDGMLSRYVTLNEAGLAKIPRELSFEEAATLPCAGVTAWNALVTRGHTQPGDFVLLEGTGGVSVIGLQLAAALGAKPIITSSSDDKLARARTLGAAGTVNYRTTPEWEKPVLELTGGNGVQQVLEVGGKDTLPHALASLGQGAHIALIGGLSAFSGDIPMMALLGHGANVSSIYVGSRADLEALLAFVHAHRIRPVVDRVFAYEDAAAAYDLMESERFFGKIVIRI
jgi:NADPH:quinone reductase-like Zn-dependent oxidoreductase